MLRFMAPVLIIVVAVPLILGLVARNRYYGFRTPRTRSSDAIWYPANRFSGITLLLAGIVWLVAALVMPSVVATPQEAILYAGVIGVTALVVSLVVSVLYLRKL